MSEKDPGALWSCSDRAEPALPDRTVWTDPLTRAVNDGPLIARPWPSSQNRQGGRITDFIWRPLASLGFAFSRLLPASAQRGLVYRALPMSPQDAEEVAQSHLT